MRNALTSYFRSGDALRSRSVSDIVRSDTLDVPVPNERVLADWQRETSTQMVLDPGDVEPMPLARTQVRWPDYKRCVQAMSEWTGALGMPGVLASADMALMACRGARFHHDGTQYGNAAFCNLFLSEDRGLDLLFPATGHRFALTRGTAVLFDTGQPHGIVRRGSSDFIDTDFAPDRDCIQIFMTWELPVEDSRVARVLAVDFDIAPSNLMQPDEERVCVHGSPASVRPESGCWYSPLASTQGND